MSVVVKAQDRDGIDGHVRINEIQIVGTHNSYHSGVAPSEAKLLAKTDPKEASALDYHHAPLEKQLDSGVRSLELDVYPDPQGGLYAHSPSFQAVVDAGLPPDPEFYTGDVMQKPGFKVMHKPATDYRSNCQPFTLCLGEIRAWSRAHPDHIPLFLFIETKLPTTLHTKDLDALDAEIRSVFPPQEIITPDLVRGNRATLREAVEKDGWPMLKDARGKVIFLMARSEVTDIYLAGHPGLRGRVLFTNGDLKDPSTVFTVQVKNKHNIIPEFLMKGLLVLTRADADTVEARTGNTQTREIAMDSGAQILSTDYPASEPASWSGYTVNFPHGEVARCNPVLRPKTCESKELEAER